MTSGDRIVIPHDLIDMRVSTYQARAEGASLALPRRYVSRAGNYSPADTPPPQYAPLLTLLSTCIRQCSYKACILRNHRDTRREQPLDDLIIALELSYVRVCPRSGMIILGAGETTSRFSMFDQSNADFHPRCPVQIGQNQSTD